MKKKWLFGIFFVGLFVDILSKILVRKYLSYGVPKLILGNFLRFTYVENPGVIFGIGSEWAGAHALVKNLLIIAFAIFVIFFLIREFLHTKDGFTRVLFVFIFTGAVGNLFERIFGYLYYTQQWKFFYGQVVDFIDIGFGSYRWFFFNFADVYISVSIFLLIFRVLYLEISARRSR